MRELDIDAPQAVGGHDARFQATEICDNSSAPLILLSLLSQRSLLFWQHLILQHTLSYSCSAQLVSAFTSGMVPQIVYRRTAAMPEAS